MGLKLTVPNASFEGAGVGLIPPVGGNLEGWFLFNETVGKACKNWAPGKLDATAQGDIVFTNGFASLQSDSKWFDTQVSETHGMTALIAARVTSAPSGAANVAVLLSNSNSPTEFPVGAATGGTNISAFGGTTMRYRDQRYNGSSSVGINTDLNSFYAVNSWGFFSFRNSDTAKTGRNLTTGASGGGADANIQNPGNAKFRLGSTWNVPSANQGTCDIAFAAFYSRVLTDAEVTKVYDWAKTYLAGRGVVV
jgi:hypothetical protein